MFLKVIAALAVLACGVASASAAISHVKKPNHNKYVACYFQSWAAYRQGNGSFSIQDIRPEHCTHLIYAFAGLNASTFEIRSLDPWQDLEVHNGKDGYRKLTQLRYQYPGLKVSLAVGGWNEGSYNYSEMAKRPHLRKRFVTSVVHFLRMYNFQGMDLDWEFPTVRGGAEYDRYNFVTLLEDLKTEFRKHDFLLTAAISADTESMDKRYDLRGISKVLDYIHIMTYDYHVLEGGVVMPNAALYEVNKTLNYMLAAGVPAKKMIMGLPTYGRGYVLAEALRSPDENPIGKRSLPNSWSGPYNAQEGFLGYNEVCIYLLSNDTWIDKWDNLSSTPYAMLISQHKVIVYDSVKSVQAKVHLAMQKGLGGVMVWSLDTDDFRGDCIPQHRRGRVDTRNFQYPLMQAINVALERDSTRDAAVSASFSLPLLVVATLVACLRALEL